MLEDQRAPIKLQLQINIHNGTNKEVITTEVLKNVENQIDINSVELLKNFEN